MTTSHVLVIEDDHDLAQLVTTEIQRAGFPVEWQQTAVNGLIAARERPPAVVILDLGLPDFDGRLVLSRLRATTQIPILVLTARDAMTEKLDILNLGANDYVVKPFQMPELVARLQVHFRGHLMIRTAGALSLELHAGRATFRGQDLELTRTEFKVLDALATPPGRVCSPHDLSRILWDDAPTSANIVRVHVGHLRRKLALAGADDAVRTVWGAGYTLHLEGLT